MSNPTIESNKVSSEKNQSAPATKAIDFGSGKYSAIMHGFYKDLIRLLALNEAQAEKAAKTLGSDMGRLNLGVEKLRFSKPNKDGYTKVSENGTMKDVPFKYSFTLFKLCQVLQEAKVYHVVDYGTEIKLSEDITKWLNDVE
jgi:hypothetical protein